jgi:hypothetical protein
MKDENKQTKTENKIENDNSVKITVTKTVADSLKELVDKVNNGFDVGRVHRQDVASWIISHFLKSYSDHEVGLIRQSQYTDSLMLESVYRRMRETGEIPEFLRDALRKQFQGGAETPKKKKALTKEYINDVLESHEESA